MIKCTIAIPVYNRENLICRAIESAVAQEAPNLEILIIDNHSSDRTWEIAQGYSDPRVRLIRNETNLGLFGNFNRCLELAGGEYLRFLCSDDELIPNCIDREVRFMDEHPEAVLLSGRGSTVDESGRFIRLFAQQYPPGIYDGRQAVAGTLWFLVHYAQNPLNYPSGVLLRCSAIKQAGKFRTDLEIMGDVEYFFRLLEHGNLVVRDEVNCKITLHGAQAGTTSATRGALLRERTQISEQFATALKKVNLYAQTKNQAAGWAIWQMVKLFSIGIIPSREFFAALFITTRGRWFQAVTGIARLLYFRTVAFVTGRYRIPMKSIPEP